jgi:hypothetical protein
MRSRVLALIVAVVALVVLVVALTASAASTPQNTVERLLEPRSPADACAQDAYTSVARTVGIGHCVARMAGDSTTAKDLVISHVVIRGKYATLQANYDYGPASPVETHYQLARRHGVWLITGTFLPVTYGPSR